MTTTSRLDPIRVFTELLQLCVDGPEHVNVRTEPSAFGATVICVEVEKTEYGKLLGVSGRTARALRTLLMNIGAANGTRYSLDIVERAPKQ